MLCHFEELKALAAAFSPTVAVACAHDSHTLEAVLRLEQEGYLRAVLIGKAAEITTIGKDLGYRMDRQEIIDASSDQASAQIAVRLIREGRADFIQKGLMQTATLLKEVVNKESGISCGVPISHTALLEIPTYPKLLGVADGGMIPSPDLSAKKSIVRNAVELFHHLGYERPVVSAVCAAETVSPKIQETVDAHELKELAATGEFGNCYVEGPISLDLAVDPSSAKVKGYTSEAAGNTDILLVPNMAAGNMMVKGLITFAGAKMVGCVTGAACPIALNSRSASFEEKYYSLLACASICRSRT